MIPLSLAQVSAVTWGTVCGDPTLVVTGPAYLDNRSPHPEGLFVAIAGKRVDGHSFAAHAVLGSRPTRRPTAACPKGHVSTCSVVLDRRPTGARGMEAAA